MTTLLLLLSLSTIIIYCILKIENLKEDYEDLNDNHKIEIHFLNNEKRRLERELMKLRIDKQKNINQIYKLKEESKR